WHFLYFFPDPQGHGSFRPTSGTVSTAWPSGPAELRRPPAAAAATGGAVRSTRDAPEKRSSVAAAGSEAGRLAGAGRGAGGGAGGPAVTCTLRKRSVKVP